MNKTLPICNVLSRECEGTNLKPKRYPVDALDLVNMA